MVDSLHRRLMYLCNLSYALAPGAVVVPVRAGELGRRDAAIGLGRLGAVVARNATGGPFRDVAVVDKIPEGIVVAVRGTLPPAPEASGPQAEAITRDWLNNGNLVDPAASEFASRVHGGFATAALALWEGADGIARQLDTLVARPDVVRRIFVTGHSKGGAVANLIAWLIRKRWGMSSVPVGVVTFAAARAGNAAFRADFNTRGIACTRYEAAIDVVPSLPLGTDDNIPLRTLLAHFGIHGSGDGVGFVGIGDRVRESPLAAAWHNLAEITAINDPDDLIANLGFVIRAHSIGPGTSYDRLVK